MTNGDANSVSYFRSLLEEETSKLNALCDKWQVVLNQQPNEPTNVTNGQEKQDGLLNEDGKIILCIFFVLRFISFNRLSFFFFFW